ncbi:hypothetical protein BGZ83_007765 [Gryganskiella cystojenkinii]|nr:hypothetical protein BGZ83_007765 [Gryganskiella cystojenkinii]
MSSAALTAAEAGVEWIQQDSVMTTPEPFSASVPSAPTVASTDNKPTSTPSSSDTFQADKYPHHVVFVVHGMGRQLEPEFGNYERNVGHLVEHTKAVLQNQFQELKTDVHIIPTEWHAKLHNMVDERMSLASLRTVPKVRLVMNDYFADILYYFNNHYGGEIIRMIVAELNEAYETFLAKHPGFNGKVSIYALSLGGVAMYDILTCIDDDEEEEEVKIDGDVPDPLNKEQVKDQDKDSSSSQKTKPEKQARIRKQDDPKFRISVPKLKFRPDQLFTVGSPVGAVMVMRNLDWKTFHPPADIIHHNLFHPFDPLGYRIEPLIDPIFAGIPPVTITPYNASQQLFPTLSLPSLSLPSIPGSLSSFWENRVPTLPRPSIPLLTTSLSQMTQSLKAGRWLSSSASSTGTSTPTAITQQEIDTVEETASLESVKNVTVSVSDGQASSTEQQQTEIESRLTMGDGDTSVQEAIAAATVATYLDQPETNVSDTERAHRAAAAQKGQATLGGRRPTLGPRRISSRVEDEQESIHRALEIQQQQHESMPQLAEEGIEPALGLAQESTSQSHVVQEPMVRSERPESTSTSTPSLETESNSRKQEQKKRGKTEWPKLMVEGRATEVPYRIDHVLQETTVDQYTNEYLLGMRSHFKYWANRDIAFHVLRNMLTPELTPPHSGGPEDTIHLRLDMPAPVTTAKGAKEAAEAIARATARSRSNSSPSAAEAEQERQRKKLNRKSFSFSFFGSSGGNSSSDENSIDREGGDASEEGATMDDDYAMDEEGELFGYNRKQRRQRRPQTNGQDGDMEIDMDMETNSTFSSMFASEDRQSQEDSDSTTRVSMKRRISVSGVHVHNSGKSRAFTSTTLMNTTATTTTVVVPELAKPAKLHHKTVRLEE